MAHAYLLVPSDAFLMASCALALRRTCPFDRDSVRAHFLEEGGRGSGLEFPPKNVYITPNTPTLVQNILGAYEERFNPTSRSVFLPPWLQPHLAAKRPAVRLRLLLPSLLPPWSSS